MDSPLLDNAELDDLSSRFVETLLLDDCVIDAEKCRKLSRKLWRSVSDKDALNAATSLLAPGVIYESRHTDAFAVLFFSFLDAASPAAVARLFRTVWSRYGIHTYDDQSIDDIKEALSWLCENARNHLMNHKERKVLEKLSSTNSINIYRGEPIWKDVKNENITGMSWTLSQDVANHYTYAEGHDNGWLVSGTIQPKYALAIFLDRDESEIIIDPRVVNISSVTQGTASHFPKSFW
jgi:hypothetical protein